MKKFMPNDYFQNITKISVDYLKEKNIKGLILDVDNTLIDLKKNKIEGLKEWHQGLKEGKISSIILSNTLNKNKVKDIAQYLDIEYMYFANKPITIGFKNAAKKMNLNPENIAVIGDQIFTDIYGANRSNMYSILVKPICEKNDYLITRLKRPLERYILKKYEENKKKNEIEGKNGL